LKVDENGSCEIGINTNYPYFDVEKPNRKIFSEFAWWCYKLHKNQANFMH